MTALTDLGVADGDAGEPGDVADGCGVYGHENL